MAIRYCLRLAIRYRLRLAIRLRIQQGIQDSQFPQSQALRFQILSCDPHFFGYREMRSPKSSVIDREWVLRGVMA